MKQPENKKIILMAGKGSSTNIVYQALDKTVGVHTVILEEYESKKLFLKRRVKKLGYLRVAGQVFFILIVVPVLRYFSARRIKETLVAEGLSEARIPEEKTMEVSSVNTKEVAELLVDIQPDVVIINGTRIISKKILSVIKCPVINIHAGITPMYRGVHGAYWALINNDMENCGVTVHLVDEGVDTGNIIYQAIISVDRKDNFVTYPLKQLAAGIPLLLRAVKNALTDTLSSYERPGKSVQWYHPTIWEYLYHRFFRRIK